MACFCGENQRQAEKNSKRFICLEKALTPQQPAITMRLVLDGEQSAER